ncbi:helix-turn-helix transcriptional regulator [Oceanobacillus jeddahense]|uniref:Helix-turn-helix transcriptional regulator n=1 Tax=Oceanobacillus jeddahense TaxID=1462527 RepID=A0ABY5JPP8_9BACI|nr:helix-turn-helix transcriptional regulator [Oceanobacillus jeddahense]UUI02267.1 helix-turn-helix transcriptional regulator [Oceanobacillus jeddahense]
MRNSEIDIHFLKKIMKGLAAQFGENCEVVLHDLTLPYDKTIIAIENGHITGRGIGDPGTNLGLEVLRGEIESGDRFNYVTQTKEGKLLRSSSIYLENEDGEVVGSLCINFDISELMMAENVIKSLTSTNLANHVKEDFVNNVNDILDSLLQESQELIGKPVAFMEKEDKIKAIHYLDKKGAFLIKKAGEKIAKFFDISKYSLYNMLEQTKNKKNDS